MEEFMGISAIASVGYSIIKAIPAVKQIFFGIQDLYYNEIFENLTIDKNDKKGRRRAISNSIEIARSDEDRQHLSILLAEFYGMQSGGHREISGKTSN